ncbi:MAG: hypothetical protein WBG41_16155 [Acidimicrobiales bacterium]
MANSTTYAEQVLSGGEGTRTLEPLAGQEAEVLEGDTTWPTGYLRAVVADGGGWVLTRETLTSPARDAFERTVAEAVEKHLAARKPWLDRWGLQYASVGTVEALSEMVGRVEQEAARRL